MRGDEVMHAAEVPTTFDTMGQCQALLKGIFAAHVVATGCGRKLFVEAFICVMSRREGYGAS